MNTAVNIYVTITTILEQNTLSLYIFTIWKSIAYNLFCRDGIYFDKILVSKYKFFKRSNTTNLFIALVYSDFLKRHLHLRNRLLDQGYKKIRRIRSLKKFIFRYQDLVEIYSVNTICRRSWYIAAHIWKIYDYTPRNEVVGGILVSPCPSVCRQIIWVVQNITDCFDQKWKGSSSLHQ
jgi:predicted nucleic acid-binding protein